MWKSRDKFIGLDLETDTRTPLLLALLCCKDADAEKDRCTVNELPRGPGRGIAVMPHLSHPPLIQFCKDKCALVFAACLFLSALAVRHMVLAQSTCWPPSTPQTPLPDVGMVAVFVVRFFFTIHVALLLEPCCSFSRLEKIVIKKIIH